MRRSILGSCFLILSATSALAQQPALKPAEYQDFYHGSPEPLTETMPEYALQVRMYHPDHHDDSAVMVSINNLTLQFQSAYMSTERLLYVKVFSKLPDQSASERVFVGTWKKLDKKIRQAVQKQKWRKDEGWLRALGAGIEQVTLTKLPTGVFDQQGTAHLLLSVDGVPLLFSYDYSEVHDIGMIDAAGGAWAPVFESYYREPLALMLPGNLFSVERWRFTTQSSAADIDPVAEFAKLKEQAEARNGPPKK